LLGLERAEQRFFKGQEDASPYRRWIVEYIKRSAIIWRKFGQRHLVSCSRSSPAFASEYVSQGQFLHQGLGIHVGLVTYKGVTPQTSKDMVSLIDEVCTPGYVSFGVIRT